MKRPFIVVIVLVLIGSAGAWFWLQNGKKQEASLTLYGTIEIRDARLAFNEQEIVAEVMVEEGDAVSIGQVLARLRPDLLKDQLAGALANLEAQIQVINRLKAGTRKQEIEQARAEVDAAKVRVNNIKKNLQRLQKTSRVGASSEQALDDTAAQLDAEQSQLEVRRQALNLALEGARREDIAEAEARGKALEAEAALLRHRLADTVLTAPAPGIIQSRILEPGEMAGPTRPAFILALTDPKWVRAYIPEPDLGRLREGMLASIFSDSWPDRSFGGRVGFISPEAEFTPKSVETTDLRTKLVYEVRVLVDDPDNQLRLGMPVTVEIAEETRAQGDR
jgi:HlyD family secretion protein